MTDVFTLVYLLLPEVHQRDRLRESIGVVDVFFVDVATVSIAEMVVCAMYCYSEPASEDKARTELVYDKAQDMFSLYYIAR
ncbi:MAG: hypothetical protein EOP06_16395 [Proteobacteria bacterium]|nr:MAG: hypothetical protein EOP06_16395 [Pseudomonadota bacterium]